MLIRGLNIYLMYIKKSKQLDYMFDSQICVGENRFVCFLCNCLLVVHVNHCILML